MIQRAFCQLGYFPPRGWAVDLKKHIVDEVRRVVSISSNAVSIDAAGENECFEISNNVFSPHKLRELFSRLFTHFKATANKMPTNSSYLPKCYP